MFFGKHENPTVQPTPPKKNTIPDLPIKLRNQFGNPIENLKKKKWILGNKQYRPNSATFQHLNHEQFTYFSLRFGFLVYKTMIPQMLYD